MQGRSDPWDRVMRWAQLTLVEDDPGKFDPKFWLDYFKRIRAQGACLSAGGCVAFYPTRIPLHHRSVFLGSSDPLGELIAGCRAQDMTVLARVDPHAFHEDAAAAHPEWVAVDEQGRPRRHWASPEMWVACTMGTYTFEFMTEVIREIVSFYQVDGIFANRWEGSGICYCGHCRESFRNATGMELPRGAFSGQPPMDWRAYASWKEEKLFALWDIWDTAIRKLNPTGRFIPNSGGGAHATLEMGRAGELTPLLVADRQARAGLTPPWVMGKYAKEYRAAAGTKPVAGLFNVGIEEQYRWKDSVNSEAEIRIWAAEAVANGMRPWVCKFSGALHDHRWLPWVERIFRWHHGAEKYLRNRESLARVAITISQKTARLYGGEPGGRKTDHHVLGVVQALVEARIPHEIIYDQLLARDLSRYSVVVLPNTALLSEDECERIRDFVVRGGGLVATFESSLYDEQGERRRSFGLADLFRASPAGEVEGPMRNSYLALNPDPATGRHHPVLRGIEKAGRIINGVWRLPVSPAEPLAAPPLTLIPSYPDLPMEKVYPRLAGLGGPELFLRAYGAGRVAYVPWDIDRSFWEIFCPDHGRLLANLVTWAMNGRPQPVSVSGPGLLDVTAWRQDGSLTIHLVNLTNPMTMKGPYRQLISLGPQKIRICLPLGTKTGKIRLLRARRKPRVKRSGRYLTVTVPSILDHEVIAVDLS